MRVLGVERIGVYEGMMCWGMRKDKEGGDSIHSTSFFVIDIVYPSWHQQASSKFNIYEKDRQDPETFLARRWTTDMMGTNQVLVDWLARFLTQSGIVPIPKNWATSNKYSRYEIESCRLLFAQSHLQILLEEGEGRSSPPRNRGMEAKRSTCKVLENLKQGPC